MALLVDLAEHGGYDGGGGGAGGCEEWGVQRVVADVGEEVGGGLDGVADVAVGAAQVETDGEGEEDAEV